jgi:phenylpyruvate tautomerase PptA (4-oxalocrotonate tautomerase family)
MPTYRCTTPRDLLNTERRGAIAGEIARIHQAVTGAATVFAQVIFDEMPDGSYFVGGGPLQSPQIHVHGTIRDGRSDLDLKRLLTELIDGVAAASGLRRRSVWVYLSELPARRMAEYGRILPEPGDEPAWLAELAQEER